MSSESVEVRPRQDLKNNVRPAVAAAAKLICVEATRSGRPCLECLRSASDIVRVFLRCLPQGAFVLGDLDEAVRTASVDA